MRPDGASLVLGHFAGTKGPRLPGRNPATQKIMLTQELGTQVQWVHLPIFFAGKLQDEFPINIIKL